MPLLFIPATPRLCRFSNGTEGAAAGVMMYLVPNFERLKSVEVWTDAGQQIFFSLSVTQGSLITLSSFNNFKQDCFTNTVIVTIVNCVTSFWVGIPVFFVLGHMSYVTGLPIEEVTEWKWKCPRVVRAEYRENRLIDCHT